MERRRIGMTGLEMPAQEAAPGELVGERGDPSARVARMLVVNHGALAGRVVDEPVGEPQLQHALAGRRVCGGFGERVPAAERHLYKVACTMPSRVVSFGRIDRAGDPDRLICADAERAAAGVRDGTLDAIYIDPPFGTGSVQRGRGHAYADRADDPDAFVAWLEPILAHSRRTLADHGSIFVHLDYRAVHYVKVALDRLFGRARFVNEIAWCYSVGGKSRRGFGRKHDTILWYGKTDDWAFFPEAVRVPRRGGSHMRLVGGVQEKTDRRTGRVYRYPVAAGKVPEDWWTDIETLNHSDGERTGWPSQKPERLVERVLRAVTATDGRVADWFAGSGTTAAVAQRLGRRFVVADREPAAIALAARRLIAQGRALASAGNPPVALEIIRGRI